MCEIFNSLVNTPAHQQPWKGIETVLKTSEVGNVCVCMFSMEPTERFMPDAKYSLSHWEQEWVIRKVVDAFSPLGPCWEVWGLLKLLWWLCTAYRKKFIFFGLAFSTPTPATSPPLFLWLLVLQKVSSYSYFLDTGSMFSARVSAHTFLPEIFSSHHHAVQPYPSFNTRIDLGSCLSHTTACSNPTQSHWPVFDGSASKTNVGWELVSRFAPLSGTTVLAWWIRAASSLISLLSTWPTQLPEWFFSKC